MDIQAFWDKHKVAIIVGLAAFILGGILCQTASAQECVPDEGNGPVDQQKSAVKKIGDTATLSWVLPTFLSDCTPISDDPSFAITSVNVYVSINTPVTAALPPIEVPASDTSIELTVQDSGTADKTKRVYYATQACNQFGCGSLSAQPWVLVGGPPGRPEAAAQ